MLSAAKETGSEFLTRYVQATIDAANLRSAVRTLRMKKGADLLNAILYMPAPSFLKRTPRAAAHEWYRPLCLPSGWT